MKPVLAGTSDLVWQRKKVRSQEFNISQSLGPSYQVVEVCRYIPQGLVHSSTCFSVNSSVCAASGADLAEVGHWEWVVDGWSPVLLQVSVFHRDGNKRLYKFLPAQTVSVIPTPILSFPWWADSFWIIYELRQLFPPFRCHCLEFVTTMQPMATLSLSFH